MVSGPSLSPFLLAHAQRTEAAARSVGLDFFEVLFEPLNARDVNALAAWGGFPLRYASWRFGMEFERLHKGYSYGLSKIYELVINNDPTIAYLVRSNSIMEQKLVMAHVFGHADFFKHNTWFAPTERHMVDLMGRHAASMQAIMDSVGQDEVERFLDAVLCLDTLIDPYLPQRDHLRIRSSGRSSDGLVERARLSLESVLDGNPRGKVQNQANREGQPPTYDVLGFLIENAPLEAWQRAIASIVRSEAYYFLPQRMTKIMNEGWATYWHSRLLTGGLLDPAEIVDFADCHAGATATGPGQLNPYKLGIELFRHAERRGMDLFQLRRIHNDVSFLDEVMDEEFAASSQLFLVQQDARSGAAQVGTRDWQAVKAKLLENLAWCGAPRVELVGVDVDGRGELLLQHHHDGRDMEISEAGELLQHVATLWGAPVQLLTQVEDQGRKVSVEGGEVRVVAFDRAGSDEGAAPGSEQDPEPPEVRPAAG